MRSSLSGRGLLPLGSVFVASLASLSACGKEARSHPSEIRLLARSEQAVTFQRDLRLEETQSVINAVTILPPA